MTKSYHCCPAHSHCSSVERILLPACITLLRCATSI